MGDPFSLMLSDCSDQVSRRVIVMTTNLSLTALVISKLSQVSLSATASVETLAWMYGGIDVFAMQPAGLDLALADLTLTITAGLPTKDGPVCRQGGRCRPQDDSNSNSFRNLVDRTHSTKGQAVSNTSARKFQSGFANPRKLDELLKFSGLFVTWPLELN